MKKPLLLMSIFIFFVSAACGVTTNFGFQTIEGSGKVITESREAFGFTQVEVCCGMELYLTQGDHVSLEIDADDNFMAEITTNVTNETLEIRYRQTNNVNYQPTQPVHITLTMPEILRVAISGGGYFETGMIESNSFELGLSGGSDAWIAELLTGDMDVSVSGGGSLKAGIIEGDQVTVGLSGGSDAQIKSLVATGLGVSNSGGGNFEIVSCQADRLDMNFSGSSDGEVPTLTAETLNLDASGGGTIKIAGTVSEQIISLSGGSSYKAGDLESEHTSIIASGGGDSMVWVTEMLSVRLNGGSNLGYYGYPQISDQNLSGGSELNSLGAHK